MFNEIKAGDEIVVASAHGKYLLKTVDRVTKTQIVVDNTKFYKDTGKEVSGNSWYRDSLFLPTDVVMKKVYAYREYLHKRQLVIYLRDTNWDDEFTLEDLITISKFIEVTKSK